MIRNTVAHVDLGAVSANVLAIRDYLAREPRNGAAVPALIAVVKANAYGHGAERVALAIEAAGADTLACADIEEGAVLRAAGVRTEILVFGALSVSDLDGLFDCQLTPTISTPGAAQAVQAAAARYKQRLRYHLTWNSTASTRTSRPPMCPTRHSSSSSGSASSVRCPTWRNSVAGPPIGTPPTVPRYCATRVSGSTWSVPVCCSTASCRRRWRPPCRCSR